MCGLRPVVAVVVAAYSGLAGLWAALLLFVAGLAAQVHANVGVEALILASIGIVEISDGECVGGQAQVALVDELAVGVGGRVGNHRAGQGRVLGIK